MVDLGAGRGLGQRWMRDDIMRAIDGATIAPVSKQESKPRPRLVDRPLYGKSRKEQVAAIMGDRLQ